MIKREGKIRKAKIINILYEENRLVSYLKKFENEILYPCCSAIPAHKILADAPKIVPFPVVLTERKETTQMLYQLKAYTC